MAKNLLSGIKLLVVDDEPDNLMVIQELLEFLGGEVFIASDGKQGFELALAEKPDLIFADLSMPVMSGWEMFHKLRQHEETSAIPVIALTAHAMAGDRERVLSTGFDNYVSKPIQIENFIPELSAMLRKIPSLADKINT